MIKISVSIDVSNLKQAEDFYMQALGCTKNRDQGSMAILSTENCDIYLQEKKVGTKPIAWASTVRDYGRHWSPIHLDFLCDDIDTRSAKIVELWGVAEWGESGEWWSIAHFSDPFGNWFCLINE